MGYRGFVSFLFLLVVVQPEPKPSQVPLYYIGLTHIEQILDIETQKAVISVSL